METLGIAPALRAKTVLVPGGLVGLPVANGQAFVGLQQMSELLAVPGIRLAGPRPPDIQNYTVYAAGVGMTASHPEAAKALLAALSDGAMASILAAQAWSLRRHDRFGHHR